MSQHSPRRTFDPQEDARLLELVNIHGLDSWYNVARELGGRTARQCRDRYDHFLKPSQNTNPWTPEEDDILKQRYEEIGPKWAALRQYFPGRTDLNVKNRFVYLTRNRPDMRELATKYQMEPGAPSVRQRLAALRIDEDRNLYSSLSPIAIQSAFQSLPVVMKRCLLLETILEQHSVPVPPLNLTDVPWSSDEEEEETEGSAELPPLSAETPDKV
jgi:hypothetical protein